ncbi:hypothetical protein YPPY66_0813 [Yersinia pestis PY-66]|uniref:Transposase n=1 Tax=Yersinia pestis biovar Orientalis str. IP275 TaxID=373665 RepID=A0AAV3BDY0_YERPE|nr:hypothetical protein YPIP275_2542 [Yersinia pestis biovar Orientalis str. IP275]EDR37110.1 hypothetical protein YpF1991016_0868 [Yersinia pestis biovar Orientalis str. F1991016]EDR44420.1 hypothetical protein YpE1979001_3042 [Yersinia pestis biovar Antiqua str. E1979001]EDR51466.1 hypothetical protein YpB42003004_4287 [Yersinia pestis biovar Antiqua str. B42003004]EDR56197.1 hypothetical protein YpMG051020_3927 [Yersinia pestis biovar Orientalis str. MG05-1020]EDR64375.1 hypothetical protei
MVIKTKINRISFKKQLVVVSVKNAGIFCRLSQTANRRR